MSRQIRRSRIGMLFDRPWFNKNENLLLSVLRLLISQPLRRCSGVLEESLLAFDQVSLPPTLWHECIFDSTLTRLFPLLWRQGPNCEFGLTFCVIEVELLAKLKVFLGRPWL